VRQLCWRDFHRQVLHATPELPRQDYRTRGDEWRRNADDLATWKEGGTGVPVVDAGMRQLAREGWMHNRSRLVTASFLTKTSTRLAPGGVALLGPAGRRGHSQQRRELAVGGGHRQ
jgi:deoxyribodipyrimidine photolyase